MLRLYNQALAKKPLLTKQCTACVVIATGDTLCQRFIEKHELDYKRTLRMACWGFFFISPTLHLWYKSLDKMLPLASMPATMSPRQFFKQNFKRIMSRVCVDQLCFAPLVAGAFFAVQTTMTRLFDRYLWQEAEVVTDNDTSLTSEIVEKWQQEYLTALKFNYMIWPAAQIFNFTFVPLQHRVLFANMISLLWSTILSYLQHEHHDAPNTSVTTNKRKSDEKLPIKQ